ncbi:MAG: ABC transporter permease, partial [Thermoanaerobaculia bacterium]
STIFMFGVLKAYVLTPLPFPESQELMHLGMEDPARGEEDLEVYPLDFLDWREHQRSFTDLAGYYEGTVNLSGPGSDRPERYQGAFLTGNAFELLGAEPHRGRTLEPRDSLPGAPDVVLLGHGPWRNRYQADPDVVGRTIRVNGREATVVGVMPRGFAFPLDQAVWVPLKLDPARLEGRDDGVPMEVLGRLRDGVSREQAEAELGAVTARLAAEGPRSREGLTAVVQPFAHEYVDRGTRVTIYSMLTAVVLVLILACTNTANLVLVRVTRQGRELAVRSALGASRRRLVGRVLLECLVLALLASALGFGLADVAAREVFESLRQGDATIPYWIDLSIDARDVLFTLGTAVLATLLAGLLPALRGTRLEVTEALKDGSGGSTARLAGRLSRALVVAEIALSCVLLVGAGLMLRSLINIDQRDYGAETSGVLIGRVGLFEEAYPAPESRARFFRELTGRLGQRPGALTAAAATALPGTDDDETRYALRGGGGADVQYARNEPVYWSVTTPGLFRMLEIPLLRGRLYDGRDRADTEPVVVVTRAFAEAAWPGEDALGRQVALSGAEDPERFRTVVGVVDDVHLAEADDPSRPGVFVPMSQNPVRFAYSAVRTAGDPLAFSDEMRRAVLSLDPDLPVYWLQTLDWWIAYGGWTDKLVAIHFEVFGAIALILAAVGLYGVLAYAVAQRTREIGVRRALGADDARIAGDMARQTLGQLAVGLALGLVLGFAFAQVLGSRLIGVETGDPLTYAAVVLLLVGVSAAAVAGPTIRALRVQPVEALRQG